VGEFGRRLAEAVSRRGPLCPGIDPHKELLRAWGLSTDSDGLAKFFHVWLLKDGTWKMARVISYDHGPAPK